MTHLSIGLLCAFLAALCWGFGDFFIQKATRTIGTYQALFCIGALGSVALLPFVSSTLHVLSGHDVLLLLLLGIITTIAAVFDFEALKRGKIAVVEPVISLELPLTVALSISLAGDILTVTQGALITLVFIGIILTITSHPQYTFSARLFIERGAIIAAVGAVGLALVNTLVGIASRETLPLLTIWFTHTFVALTSAIVLLLQREWPSFLTNVRRNAGVTLAQSVFDNAGWIAYAFATTVLSIAVANTIAETYVILAVILGIAFNGERLRTSQHVGIALAIIGVLALAGL